jgi:broad specificity phosphatase PhoE
MRIYLVRHGKTVENTRGTVNGGGAHGTLTGTGIRQAKIAAQKLKGRKIAAIYSSDLKRARDTAKEIAKFHKVQIHYTKALREMDYGPFEGHKFSNKAWKTMRKILYSPDIKVEGVESAREAHARVNKLMKEVAKRHKNESVIFVAHSGIGRMITAVAKRKPIHKAEYVPRLNNGAIRHLKMK